MLEIRNKSIYAVKKYETLADVALFHGIPEELLRELNELDDEELYEGQELRIRPKFRHRLRSKLQKLHIYPTCNGGERILHGKRRTSQRTDEDEYLSPTYSMMTPSDFQQQRRELINQFMHNRLNSCLGRLEDNHPFNHNRPKRIDSTPQDILCDKLLIQLNACLPVRYQYHDWVQLYNSAQHGSSLYTLLSKAYGHIPSILIVETLNGDIFGGFNSVEWTRSNKYYGNGESFVFTCLNDTFQVYSWQKKNYYFVLSNDKSIAMGGGGDFAWMLDSDLMNGTSGTSETFGNPRLTQDAQFEIASVEVWGFTAEAKN